MSSFTCVLTALSSVHKTSRSNVMKAALKPSPSTVTHLRDTCRGPCISAGHIRFNYDMAAYLYVLLPHSDDLVNIHSSNLGLKIFPGGSYRVLVPEHTVCAFQTAFVGMRVGIDIATPCYCSKDSKDEPHFIVSLKRCPGLVSTV